VSHQLFERKRRLCSGYEQRRARLSAVIENFLSCLSLILMKYQDGICGEHKVRLLHMNKANRGRYDRVYLEEVLTTYIVLA
jgi:hypothetical protein